MVLSHSAESGNINVMKCIEKISQLTENARSEKVGLESTGLEN